MLGRMPAAGRTQHWFYASRPWPPSSHSWAGTEESDTKTAGADTPNAAAETANRREVGSPPPGERAGRDGGGIRRVRHRRRVGVARGPSNSQSVSYNCPCTSRLYTPKFLLKRSLPRHPSDDRIYGRRQRMGGAQGDACARSLHEFGHVAGSFRNGHEPCDCIDGHRATCCQL